MSDRQLATVVINNYNYGRFLRDAVESALSQSYRDTEVVIVDDGSTDNSREVMASFGKRVTSLLKDNGGQASAYNAGIEASRGDAILFLDADDMLLPTAVEAAMPFFEEQAVSMVHWPLCEVDEAGNPTGRISPQGELKEGDLRGAMIREGYTGANSSPGGLTGSVFARWFLQRVCPVLPTGDGYGADGYVKTLAPVYGLLRRVAQPQGLRRVHGKNVSGGQSIETKIRRDLRRHQFHCEILAQHLSQTGSEVDSKQWESSGSYYCWMKQTFATMQRAKEVVPRGAAAVLVDDGYLGTDWLEGCRLLPFLECDGKYWGRPVDGENAVSELQRMWRDGAHYILLVPWTFWWLETYRELEKFLLANADRIADSEELVAFRLHAGAKDGASR